MLECVVNISEGRDAVCLQRLADAAGSDLLDVHTDADHHRSVFTLVGEAAPRALATAAIERLDLRNHDGVHPRRGVVDVVPFVPLAGSSMSEAVAARDDFATWLADRHDVPSFLYGPERSLPDIRRHAFRGLAPSRGPSAAHPSAGATAVGARPLLVAFNVWVASPDPTAARQVASEVRGGAIRALGLQVGDATQVSMNLTDPLLVGPAAAYALVRSHLRNAGVAIDRAELVGLVPEAVLHATPPSEWDMLDLAADRTIEARLAERAARGSS
jgi:glutamate formiminotransferase / 5-formyltetrahydrofolate cyclo-ligase